MGKATRGIALRQVVPGTGVVKDPEHAEKLSEGNRETSVVSEGTDRYGKMSIESRT